MGLTNDSSDIWIEGPEKQEKDFINLLTMNNDALTKAIIRTIKGRTYRLKLPNKHRKKRDVVPHNKNYWTSIWGQLIRNPNVSVPNSTMYKRFRRRFRIPFELFGPLVEECKSNNIFASVAETISAYHGQRFKLSVRLFKYEDWEECSCELHFKSKSS